MIPTGDTSQANDGSTSEGDETGTLSVCLTPHPQDIPLADDLHRCISPDAGHGEIALVYTDWPELVLDDCGEGKVEIDVPCVAQDIVMQSGGAAIALLCKDDSAQNHALTLTVSEPQLFFPICTQTPLQLHYAYHAFGCPNGGHSEAMVLREDDEILAAKFYGKDRPWIEPLEIADLEDHGCPLVGDSCVSTVRGAVQIGDPTSDDLVVYDGTRRLVQLAALYVVEASVVHEVSMDGCETFQIDEVLLSRAEP